MPFVLFLLSVATLVAVSSHSKAAGKRTQTFTLDANMPDALRNQVLAALVSGTDPATLDAFGTAIQAQYPLSAGLLHAKATSLRAGASGGTSSPALPTANDPGGPPLDPSMPPAMVAFVHTELASETDPMKLVALANTIGAQYPIAAGLLDQRAAVLNVQPAQPSQPAAPSNPPASPPPTPTPATPSAPALNMPGLDPGMPPDLAQAVMGELVTDNDPAKLQAFAQQLQGQYPLAANLLASKANTLLALQQQTTPAPQPTPVASPAFPSGSMMGMDANMPPETVQLVLNELANETDPAKLQALADQLAPQFPIAAALLRTRANVILATQAPAGVLPPPAQSQATYLVQQGDYPWKIAEKLTGHGARWPELVAANPAKPRAKDGNFATLLPGERLSLPGAWGASAPSQPPPTIVVTNDGPSGPPVVAPPAALAPVPAASPSDGIALDPNIPPNVAAAVRNALQTATDPNQVRGFANAIQPRYPKAADLLSQKANALAAFGPSKGGVVLASTPPASPPPADTVATYKVKAGDSPSKIAAALVRDGNRWKELVAANPQKKRAANGNFASLLPGEVLQLPPSWSVHGAPARTEAGPQGGA